MKRSEAINKLEELLKDPKYKDYDWDSGWSQNISAEDIIELAEIIGMLPPERPDESPVGYGAAYLDDETVTKNYFKFKHSWEPDNE